ncbi:lantibiotic dehydratase [Phytohabitans rumicis]|uniref:Lantibiotic dehydratase n=1 Tax=Phytohabitans rumicis TaxID=1076125 RepID=A0A6V8KVS3_9ACTN|nr:lantibiotic dehydratase [Phytohabitans rumicis]GFJ87490.1 lantibiotic dehydratase [Phytohabitans rumicis]
MSKPTWRLWDDLVLRGTGFPVQELLRLADPETARAALDPDNPPQRLRESWERGIRRTAAALLDLGESDAFRAALLWQNPAAVQNVTGWLRRHAGDTTRSRDRRRRESTLARYAQRYHARNETIGFFGPSVWTRFDEDVPVAELRPGPAVIAQRSVHFEDWVIDALAAAVATDPAVRHRIAAARVLGAGISGTLAVHPDGTPRRLPPLDAAVLAAVDGKRTARVITVDLRWRQVAGTPDEDDVHRALDRLAEFGLIRWRPNIPVDRRPERALRAFLGSLPDSPARERAHGALERLVAARDEVAAAGDRPAPLAAALARLDETVAELTGTAAVRARDERQFGRRAVYEDCARDIDVVLGAAVRDALLPPLSLVLDSARWLMWRLGGRLEALVGDLHDEFAAMTGGGGVPLATLVSRLLDRLSDPSWAAPAVAEFQKSWSEILAWAPGERRVRRESAELAAAAATWFAAPPAGWYGAAHHSPDVMIAAAGPEALRAGRFELVLGEVHLAMATLDNGVFTWTHPDPAKLLREAEAPLAGRPRVVPLYPRSPKVSGRDYPTPTLFSDRYWYLAFAPGNGERAAARGRSLALDALTAERTGGSVTVRLPSGQRLPVLDVVGELAQEAVVNLFRPLPPAAHTPRVTIDRLVFARERWRISCQEVPVGAVADEAAAFAALRRWAASRGMPRFVFWRAAAGTKPVYLDFDSPLFVNDFLAAVRQARRREDSVVDITEMHPDPEHVWLPDADGRLYTSELRLVAVDRA